MSKQSTGSRNLTSKQSMVPAQTKYILFIIVLLLLIQYMYMKRNEPLLIIEKHFDCRLEKFIFEK